MKNYETEARSRWGNTDAWREHEQKTKNYTKEKWTEANDGLMAIFAEFAAVKASVRVPIPPKRRHLPQMRSLCTHALCRHCPACGLHRWGSITLPRPPHSDTVLHIRQA